MRHSALSTPARTLVVVATYNEIENLPRLVDEIFQYAPDVEVLVIDDNSPDGTGRWCEERVSQEPRLACLHRVGKLGLGSATLAGFKYAIERNYGFVLTMDADFSHQPKHLPALRAGVEPEGAAFDVMIGSRYVAGGGIEGWPLRRRLMSRAINTYARWMLGLRVNDCSGAFRCYRVTSLRTLDFEKFRSRGYAYLEEILWLLHRQQARFGETPITFVDRVYGQTKINTREAAVAILLILRFGIRRWLGL
ncbi:MAG: polyprenol monophosphomannose synthase [Planctomycetia bacterium]|nr:polyprenol monophosphomannose synthase [Planctomycetia bacterium]